MCWASTRLVLPSCGPDRAGSRHRQCMRDSVFFGVPPAAPGSFGTLSSLCPDRPDKFGLGLLPCTAWLVVVSGPTQGMLGAHRRNVRRQHATHCWPCVGHLHAPAASAVYPVKVALRALVRGSPRSPELQEREGGSLWGSSQSELKGSLGPTCLRQVHDSKTMR